VTRANFLDRTRVGGWYSYGGQFVSIDTQSVDELYDLIHEFVVPDLFGWFKPRSVMTAIALRLRSHLPQLGVRRSTRRPLVLPVRLHHGREAAVSVTTDVSGSGIGIIEGDSLERSREFVEASAA
jgi:hypothetical protein